MKGKILLRLLQTLHYLSTQFPRKASFDIGELFKDADAEERNEIVNLLLWMKEEGLIRGEITSARASNLVMTAKLVSLLSSEREGGTVWTEEIEELLSTASLETIEKAAFEFLSLLEV